MNDDGKTPEAPQTTDKCPKHVAGGRHYFIWMPGRLCERKKCQTCGEERDVKRFEGQ